MFPLTEHFGILRLEREYAPSENGGILLHVGKNQAMRARVAARHWGLLGFGDDKITRLETGDFVTVFNTVAKGDIAWDGAIDLVAAPKVESGWPPHGLQRGMALEDWDRMFAYKLPATMERSGAKIYGALEAYNEQGTEGVHWAIMDYAKTGYAALSILKNGDKLTVYSKVTDGNAVLDTRINLDSLPTAIMESLEKTPDDFKIGADNAQTLAAATFRNYPATVRRRERKFALV